MAATTARRQIMIFAMGAMALITLATTIIVGAHYWEMLSGVFLIAIVGLALPDWVAWWATFWHARATKQGQEDPRVSWTALVVSAVMSLVMILNAGAVLAVWWDDKKAVEARNIQAESATSLERAKSSGEAEVIATRGRVIQQMRESGATNATIQQYIKSEAQRDKTKAIATVPEKTVSLVVTPYVSQVPEPVKKYMAFWVYIVPFLFGLIGVFAIVIAIALPGGVEFGSRQASETPKASVGFASSPAPTTAKQGSTTFNTGSPSNFTQPRP